MKRKFLRYTGIISAILLSVNAIPNVQYAAVPEPDKLIALTFDDGPNTTTTNEVLDILEKYDAKASFFLIGNNINEESAQSVKRAYDMGCEIDNHSKTHPNMGGMTAEEIAEEFDYVDEKVIEITGEPTKFFRAPFIDVSQTMYETIDVPFICGIDPKDYMENVTAEERAEFIISNAEDGVIVLLHDAAGNSKTVEAIETAIPVLQEQGYEFVTLTELFEKQGETPKEDMMYSKMTKYPCKEYTLHSNIYTGAATGDSSWSGWSDAAVLDREVLKELGNSYAIEVECQSTAPPVIALQKWSGTAVWMPVQPYYFNGDKACFLAEDIIEVLESIEIDYTELDRMTIMPSAGTLTMTKADILVRSGQSEEIFCDVNNDGEFNLSDITSMQKFLVNQGSLENKEVGDVVEDNHLDVFDLIVMERKLLNY